MNIKSKNKTDKFNIQNYDNLDNLIKILKKNKSININEFLEVLDNEYNFDIDFEICKAFGVPILLEDSNIYLKTNKDIFNQTFCIVDIETTGFSPIKNNIIEIGAIKYKNGDIVDKFESYVFSDNIPLKIIEITGINNDIVVNSPTINKVLHNFKIFLKDSIFMAHNAMFDFNFINNKLVQNKIPVMKNRVICTLALARKTLKAEKYGLEFLNKFLGINYPIRHRAYADCFIALKVFENSILNIPRELKIAEDLIDFATIKK